MNGGVEFVAVDLPQANPLTLHILAAVAEAEARSTYERTKAALAAARSRGAVLGNPNACDGLPPEVWHKGLLSARVARRRLRDQGIEAVAYEIKAGRAEGASYRQIAGALNDDGYLTATGRPWGPMSIWLAARRIGASTS